MAGQIDIARVSWSIAQENAANGEKIVNWLRQLMDLTVKRDEEYNQGFISNLTIMLMGRFERWYFSIRSMEYVASKTKYFPVYKELCELLSEWIDIEKQRRFEAGLNQDYKKDQSFIKLDGCVKGWIRSYFNCCGRRWKEEDEQEDPSFGEQEFRESRLKVQMLKFCPQAYQYLFPREWEKLHRTDEQRRLENAGSWVSDTGVLHTINEIEQEKRHFVKKVLVSCFKTSINRYAPQSNALVEEQYPTHQKDSGKQNKLYACRGNS